MEKVLVAANLSTNVEMGMSYMEDTTRDFFLYFAGGLASDLKKELSIGGLSL